MLKYFLLFIVIAKFSVIYGFNEQRISNSIITPPDMFPFAVPLGHCTASIISNRHLLCAAHCYKDQFDEAWKNNRTDTYMFTYFKGDPNANIGWRSFKLYFPLNSSLTWYYDFVVLEYPEGTNFSEIAKPVKLAKDYYEKEGDEVYITGFGAWWDDGNKTSGGSDILRHGAITIAKDCFENYIICGGNRTHRSLPGDSGGPMLLERNNQWYQIGVGSGSGGRDFRARVSFLCNFVEEVTKNEVKCESIYPERVKNQLLPIKLFQPIYKGQSTPIELLNFVVPLYNYYYNQGCTGTVISKRHLLTSGFCIYRDWWAESKAIQLTKYSSYKTITGKIFPDFRTKNVVKSNFKNEPINVTAYFPSSYVWPWDNNIGVIEFPEGTNFGIESVTLAKDYLPFYLDNSSFILVGYGLGDIKHDIQHTEESPPLLLHEYALPKSELYSHKTVKNENLSRHEGGPMLYEKNGKFYQIGVHYHSGTPNGTVTPVSRNCDFIEEVTKNEVKCESLEPIYIFPETTTTILRQKPNNSVFPNEHIKAKPLSNGLMIQFNMVLFIFVFTLFYL